VVDYIDTYNDTVAECERVKTAAELAVNNTSEVALFAPTLTKGDGYTVTWRNVDNAHYYTVHDDNDYRERIVIFAAGSGKVYTYKAEVVGNHNITVTAHSYYEEFNSATSNVVATPEVKPVFSYKSMQDGLYKFSDSQMSTMGISDLKNSCYYDKNDKKYFVYYNKNTGWSPNGADATDWTSPAEFPAHAQRLKDMGNNIILVARDTAAEYKAEDTWTASRLRYVMDTAW
jgi:plastocyanin